MKHATTFISDTRRLFPGFLMAVVIALASAFLSEHYGGPTLLFALLFGMVCNFLSDSPSTASGIHWTSRYVLHIGVALLGARMGLDTFTALGLAPVLTVLAGTGLTILFGLWLAKRLGLPKELGLLSGGATGICGASAALAIAALLPKNDKSESHTLFTLVTVTALSTTCMVLYPLLVKLLGFDDHHAGILIGTTIHDVAGVVGAGYIVSDAAGDNATVVKLMRVALLVPVCLAIAFYVRRDTPLTDGQKSRITLPWFLVAFAALSALASLHLLPEEAIRLATELSRWCLIIAIAALGMKTSLGALRHVGIRPVLLMVAETLFLLAVALIALTLY